ncbi:MAG: TolC family protein [Nitrospirota bacterium]
MQRSSWLLALFLLVGPLAWCQPELRGRSLEELVTLALNQNGSALVMEQQVAAAKGGLVQARLRPNPTLELNGMQEYRGPMNSFTVGASIPLELFGRRDRRIDVAERGIALSEFERADVARQLRGEVASKFGYALAAEQSLQFTVELLRVNREALKLMEVRAEQGAIPTLDASLFRVEVNRIDSLRAEAESRFGVALLELKSLVGMKPEEELRIRGTLDPAPLVSSKGELIAGALDRPDFRAMRSAEAVANARVRQAQTEGKLDASLSASFQRMDSGYPLNGLTSLGQPTRIQGIFNLASIGVSITLPTRNRNEGMIATALAELEGAKRRREYAELVVTREVTAALLQQAKAKESLDIYAQGVRQQSRENLAVIQRVYELGRSQLLDVIAEQRRLIETEIGYIDTLNRYYQASVRVRLAAGIE